MPNRWLPIILCALLVPGCRPPRPALRVDHPDATVKIPAMKKAVREQDRRHLDQLIEDLNSDDPAVRFFAIETLQRLTGRDMDYHYWQDESQRQPAIERWRLWLAEQNS